MAVAFNQAALEYFNQGNLQQAIEHHRNALIEFSKIPHERWNEGDEKTLLIYQRNLIYVLSEKGNNDFYKNDFAKAMECFLEAEKVINEIKKELVEKEDMAKLELIKYKLVVARQHQTKPIPLTQLFTKRKVDAQAAIEFKPSNDYKHTC